MTQNNIIDIKKRLEDSVEVIEELDSHLTGAAKCLACGHEWVAVAPVSEELHDLVCPKCDTRRGQLIYPPELPEEAIIWQHSCGNRYFTLTFVDDEGIIAKGTEAMRALDTSEGRSHHARLLCYGCGTLLEF